MTELQFAAHRSTGVWGRLDDAGEVRAVCVCGWRGPVRRSIIAASADLESHLDEQQRIAKAIRLDNEWDACEALAATEHRSNQDWIFENGYHRSVCACGWRSPIFRELRDASRALHTHIDDKWRIEQAIRADNVRKIREARAATEHVATPRWPITDGLCRAQCQCGWRSAALDIPGARQAMKLHLENPNRGNDGAEGGNVLSNPDLPKVLRALAHGTLARANKHDIILNAAADELDRWRELERAKVRPGAQESF